MSTQFAENTLTYNEFLDYLRLADDVRIVGPSQVTTPGLRVWLLIKDVWRAFRIIDQLAATQITSSGLSVAAVSNSFPTSLTQALAVRFPANAFISIATGIAPAVNQLTLSAVSATQISLVTAANNLLVKNLDAVNTVYMGDSAVTSATGYALEPVGTSDDSLSLQFVNPSNFWAIAGAGTPKICFLIY